MTTMRLHPTEKLMALLELEALKYDTTPSALTLAILKHVLEDGLMDAVIDGSAVNGGATLINRDAWTAERINRLCDMAKRGCTAAAVATTLGVSRNAVIGKASRLGVKWKHRAGRRKKLRYVEPSA